MKVSFSVRDGEVRASVAMRPGAESWRALLKALDVPDWLSEILMASGANVSVEDAWVGVTPEMVGRLAWLASSFDIALNGQTITATFVTTSKDGQTKTVTKTIKLSEISGAT